MKPYVALGPDFCKECDTLAEAQEIVKTNKVGAVYVILENLWVEGVDNVIRIKDSLKPWTPGDFPPPK